MKKIVLGMIAGLALLQAGAGELSWMTDVPKAEAKAKTEHKLVMMDFTGSDWCGWCIKLHKEVFSQPEFSDYAAKNLVLVEVDFPRKKEQSDDLKKANQSLQKKYSIEGYPTIIVLDGQGKKVGQLGYMPGGPKAFIAELEKLKKQST
jgi:protein disulfide-isomerase